MKILRADNFCQFSSAEVVEASFEIALMIAQAKKPHNIGETLIKPCMLKATSLVLEETNSKKLAKISLSNSILKTLIDELANDIVSTSPKINRPRGATKRGRSIRLPLRFCD